MTAVPITQPAGRRGKIKIDIPRIRFWSLLGFESVLWGVVIAHLAKWAGNATYFLGVQVRYAVGYKGWTGAWYLKDFWDRLVVHVQNGLPGEIAALCGIGTAVGAGYVLWSVAAPRKPWSRVLTVLLALAAGVAVTLLTARSLAGWHVHWFPSQEEPAWWVTWRHDIRDVGIALAATIGVQFLYTKPKYAPDDQPGVRKYLTAIPKALAAALVPITALAILAWQLPWVLHHGWQIPASYGDLASEVNGFIAAGTWITVLMGIAGGLAARPFLKRVADDVQWFFAERSAGRILSNTGLNALRGNRNVGTPIHRSRVSWLQARHPDLPARSPWVTRLLMIAAVLTVMLAGFGAWLTIAGPAAVH